MKIAFYTLGCKVNQYETQALEQLFRGRGHEVVPFPQEADAYVINTCTVTAVSDKKSRQTVRRVRREHPGALVAVCGCYSQTHPEEAQGLGADIVAGSGDRIGFADLLERSLRDRAPATRLDNALERRSFEMLPPGGLEGRTRAMLKVEDGCVNFCTYCIIPYARGPVRSLPAREAASQAAALQAEGYRELVLTGIEISSWGRDLPGKPQFADLLEAVCSAAPDCRIRLGSLEPRTVTPEFCSRAARLENLCPHFHLSMQSGCDAVLKRMNRRYDSARFAESVSLLREHFRDPAVTTDLIVGFPGETEEEFETTLDFIRRCAFSSMHIFPYSRRPGTPAAKMPGQIRTSVKEERARRAAAAAAEMENAFLSRRVGEELPVLFEEEKDGFWRGHSPRYLEVLVRSEQDLHNRMRKVKARRVLGSALLGDLAGAEDGEP